MSAESNSEKSVSYQKKDGHGHARPSFSWYDNDKDLKVGFLVTRVNCPCINCFFLFSTTESTEASSFTSSLAVTQKSRRPEPKSVAEILREAYPSENRGVLSRVSSSGVSNNKQNPSGVGERNKEFVALLKSDSPPGISAELPLGLNQGAPKTGGAPNPQDKTKGLNHGSTVTSSSEIEQSVQQSQSQGIQTSDLKDLETSGEMSGSGVGGNTSNKSNLGTGKIMEHQATVDRGLKMKIKRTKNSSSKHGDSKHEIVKASEKSGHGGNVAPGQGGNLESTGSGPHSSSSNIASSSSLTGSPMDKLKHSSHSSAGNQDSGAKSEKSSKSGRSSLKKGKDKVRNSTSVTTASGPDHMSNGREFHQSNSSGSAGMTGSTSLGAGNSGSSGNQSSASNLSGSGSATSSGGINNCVPGIMPVSVELDRISGPPFGGSLKREPVHDPYEFNAKLEDRPVGFHTIKKIKVEKVRFCHWSCNIILNGILKRIVCKYLMQLDRQTYRQTEPKTLINFKTFLKA